MRLPDTQIKQAILHPEPEVRLRALWHFNESFTDDDSIMPLVIEAAERFGGEDAFNLLVNCRQLPQTPATIDWLINQLRRPFDTEKEDEDNFRFALAYVLAEAHPELLARRYNDIVSLPAFPEPMKRPLAETLNLEFSDWPTLWAKFEEAGRESWGNERLTKADHRRFHQLVKAMAHHREAGGDQVLSLLRRQYKGFHKGLMVWLEPEIVSLAGWMKLEAAIPLLLRRLDEKNEAVSDEVGTALVRIGGDAVIQAVVKKWKDLDDEGRQFLIEPLDNIHSDLALSAGLSLLRQTRDIDLFSALADAVLSQFATESIEPVRQLLLAGDEESVPEYWDLRYRLITTTTIMGERFPEYDEWHEEAVASNYGVNDMKDRIEPFRLADAFVEDDESQRPARRIKPKSRAIFQIKVALKDIKPPIWRRLLVPDCTLDDLHEIIQVAMGWQSYHLYCFKIGGAEFTHPEMDDGDLNMKDATALRLSEFLVREKQKLIYTYDFGDGWKHEVVVEKIIEPEQDQKYPVCVGGKRACPPEDVGGPWGYGEYLEAMADPTHERHEEFLGWRGKFDSEVFDMESVNRELRRVFR